MPKDESETQYRKSNVTFGSTLLAGSIFAGPIAPLVAITGVAFLVGTGLRSLINKKAKEDYKIENQEIQSSNSATSFYPESPETAIARRDSYDASRLLKDLSNDRVSEKALETYSSITREYLERLSQERIDQIKQINISFDRKKSLRNILLNEESGFNLKLEVKE